MPDVALIADPLPGIFYRHGGAWFVGGGTSAAAPQWAGFLALLNQRDGGRGLGHPGPRLYAACGSSAYHDIVGGGNGDYDATPGWDAVTGLGSVSVRNLLAVY